jgi:hypothetical protein
MSRNVVIPGITFKITNLSKKDIPYLNTKIVFLNETEFFSETVIPVISENNPLTPGSVTASVQAFSPDPIVDIFENYNYRAQIYVSQKKPDEWHLYRNTDIRLD